MVAITDPHLSDTRTGPRDGSRGEAAAAGIAPTPLLLLAAAFWGGIALSSAAAGSPSWPESGAPLLFLPAAGLALWNLFPAGLSRRGRGVRAGRGARTILLLCAAFIAGVLSRPAPGSDSSLAEAVRALGAERLARPVRLEGVLQEEPEDSGRRTSLTIAVERLGANRAERNVRGMARIGVAGDHRESVRSLSRGARIAVWSRVSEPRSPANPGAREVRGRIAIFGSTKSGRLVREIAPGPAPWRALQRLRARIRERLRAGGFPEEVRAVVTAMLIGDRSLAPPETERAFRDAGTLHLMAVSGLHVGLLSVLLYGGLVLAGVPRRRALAVLLLVLPLYAGLCGGRPSVVRAVLMAGVVILGLRRGLAGQAMNGLGLAALALLAHSPWNALDAGFQLSFAATLAIVAAFRPEDPADLSWDRPARWRDWVLGPLGVTLAAQLATFPIVAWHFGRVVFGGLLVAVPAGLLAGPVLGLGFAWLALAGTGVPGEIVGGLLSTCTTMLIGLSEWGAGLPFGAFPVARPGPGWLLVWLLLAAVCLKLRGKRRVLAAVPVTALAVLTLPLSEPVDGTLRITALDVGMGDAVVVSLPAGGAVLLDAGTAFGGWSAGEAVVTPFLAAAGYRRLRAAIPTHGDLDHVGGLPAILRDFRVDEVWEGGGTAEDRRPAVRGMHRERTRRGIPVRRLRAGERFALQGVRFSVLLAGDHAARPEDRPNERSLVFAVDFAGRRVLLTGDAGAASERVLLRRYGAALRADVLKVGHHGSRSSTTAEFLAAVAPEIALVSVRADPRRRLPDEGVLDRLAASGARVFRTDRSGAVTVVVGPEGQLSVQTFRGAHP
jgi:competence protein ComEC